MIEKIKRRWNETGGYRQLLGVAIPLILSMGSHSVLIFVDRMFLSWHSADEFAAAQPAGILNFALLCFFLGMCLYTSTFVAQYVGAKRLERVGPAIWHGLGFAILGGLILPLFAPFAKSIFALIGHAPELQMHEAKYFSILNFGAFAFLANGVFSTFFSGRGQSWPIVWINISMMVLNLGLDYALIFGNWGLPEMGIAGAGIGTVISAFCITGLYIYLICRKHHHQLYHTRPGMKFEKDLFLRMMRFGAPSGAHFFLDVMGFSIFVLLIGRIGKLELAASNIVLNINLLTLLPIIGLGTATSIMVGQFQGAKNSALAEKATHSAIHLAVIHNAAMGLLYLLLPGLLIAPFIQAYSASDAAPLIALATTILRIFIIIIFLDSIAVITGGTLKGAGDTRFVMWTLVVCSVFIQLIPSYIVIEILQHPLHDAWYCHIGNLLIVAAIFFMRFKSGKWKAVQVIEE